MTPPAPSADKLRLIFVPGMKPKPPPEIHTHELCRCLTSGLAWARPEAARKFTAQSSCLTLVPWTYRFYGSDRDIALHLGVHDGEALQAWGELEGVSRAIDHFDVNDLKVIGDRISGAVVMTVE